MHWKVISIDFWNLNTAYHQVTHTITQPHKDNKHNVNLFAKYNFTLHSRISMLVNTMHIAHVLVHTSYCIRINHNISFASFICVRWKFKHICDYSQQNSKQSLLYWVRFECNWSLKAAVRHACCSTMLLQPSSFSILSAYTDSNSRL